MCDMWLIIQYFLPYFYSVTKAERAIFAYFDLLLEIYVKSKCHLQCEICLLCSLHSISLLLNTFSKFSKTWKLTWIWRHVFLVLRYLQPRVNKSSNLIITRAKLRNLINCVHSGDSFSRLRVNNLIKFTNFRKKSSSGK
jgi:hypothetical protein